MAPGHQRVYAPLGALVLAASIAGGWYLRRWLRTDAGRWWADRLRLRLPLVGPVFLGLAVARFCRVFGTLLHNGVPIVRSLEISRDAAGNRVLAKAISNATENISGGQSLAGPFGASGQFPPVVVEMIAVAEQANNLETVLLSVADSLERHDMAAAGLDRAADRTDHAVDFQRASS